jgi:hypothetical protein
MVDVFENGICNYCKNKACSRAIVIVKEQDTITYRCDEYIKDITKIVPYEKPLLVTAKRDYVTDLEV